MGVNSVFRNYVQKNLWTRVNYITRPNPRLFTGEAVEDVFRKVLNEGGKEIYVWNITHNNKKYLYIEGYEKDFGKEEEEEWVRAWRHYYKIIFILLNPDTLSIRIREYNTSNNIIIEYPTFENHMQDVYGINCTPYIQKLQNALNENNIINNSKLDDYISYIERKNKDTLLFKMDSFIFGDLISEIKNDEKSGLSRFYQVNLDILLSKSHVIECKGKTRFTKNRETNTIIINNWELSILRDLVEHGIDVTMQIMLFDDEKESKKSLLNDNGLHSDASILYLSLTPDKLNLFTPDIDNYGQETQTIKELYFTEYRHPYMDLLKEKGLYSRPNIKDLMEKNKSKATIDRINREVDDYIQDYIISIMERYNIMEKNHIWFEKNNGLLIGHIGDKKILCKYNAQLAWRDYVSVKKFEFLKDINVDYIVPFIFYDFDPSTKNYRPYPYECMGYATLDEYKDRANIMPDSDYMRNNGYRNWMRLPLERRNNDIANSDCLLYSYSIDQRDVEGLPNMKPYIPMKKFGVESYIDFAT